MSKLATLAEDWGFSEVMDMFEAATFDSVSPGICMNNGCSYSTEVEPDQDRGWCEECGPNSVRSALICGGLI